jgi:hypothetical protein
MEEDPIQKDEASGLGGKEDWMDDQILEHLSTNWTIKCH